MLQNAAIDIAIGLAMMYLLLSLTCTVINEYIATKLSLRSKSLAAGLQELLDDPNVRNAFYAHGLVAGTRDALMKARDMSLVSGPGPASAAPAAPAGPPPPDGHPSYLSSETFVLALVGALTATRLAAGRPTPGFAEVQTAIQNLPPSKIKDALVANLMAAQGDFDRFRKNVARWFDDSMDRLSGAYKRHLKFISIVVGCVVAVGINADTFQVGFALWSDGALRAQMVQVADATSKAERPAQPSAGQGSVDDITQSFRKANDQLRPLPIGWPIRQDTGTMWSETWLWSWLVRVTGWFVTGLALSFGAPFWFDTLSQFMNIRAAGAKPQRQT